MSSRQTASLAGLMQMKTWGLVQNDGDLQASRQSLPGPRRGSHMGPDPRMSSTLRKKHESPRSDPCPCYAHSPHSTRRARRQTLGGDPRPRRQLTEMDRHGLCPAGRGRRPPVSPAWHSCEDGRPLSPPCRGPMLLCAPGSSPVQRDDPSPSCEGGGEASAS